MGEEFIGQLSYHHRALKLVSIILLIFAIVPGMPTLPFITLAAITFGISYISAKQQDELGGGMDAEETNAPDAGTLDTPEEVQALLPLDQLELEVGYGLIPLVDEEQNGNLLSRIRSIRRQFALDMGVVIPSLHLRDNLQLKPGEYRVVVKGNPVAQAELLIDHFLAMDPGDAKHRIEGVETVEPAFNLPAVWIPEAQKEEAMLAGYTVVDPSTVIATHLTEVFRRNLKEFLGRQETQELLDNLAKRAPKAVESLVPAVLSVGGVQKVLQSLVEENVSIRDLLTIVETLADYATATQDPGQLTEYVRAKNGPHHRKTLHGRRRRVTDYHAESSNRRNPESGNASGRARWFSCSRTGHSTTDHSGGQQINRRCHGCRRTAHSSGQSADPESICPAFDPIHPDPASHIAG